MICCRVLPLGAGTLAASKIQTEKEKERESHNPRDKRLTFCTSVHSQYKTKKRNMYNMEILF